jgi:hypothetical protein
MYLGDGRGGDTGELLLEIVYVPEVVDRSSIGWFCGFEDDLME